MMNIVKMYLVTWIACAVAGATSGLLIAVLFGSIATWLVYPVTAVVGLLVAWKVNKIFNEMR